ncbi:cytochrome P450 [Kitasatospora phosalacinea]|uniref:Cytochrome P450 n=1 Tax=Kitasatospora phosalacinea TaxID=2065 RepID=A0A9W6V5G3_9ACTN|nr:cytochrome P450 [Kitasatospora phosalacinea]GLW73202.1 cytochrome P450 [Kitasatospora phosalacinea]
MTRHDTLQQLLADPRVGKGVEHWRLYREGLLPEGWPLMTFVTVPGMTTSDGADHRRLRALATQALTPRRIAELAPAIERRVAELLDALAGADGDEDGTGVDLRARFAYPLPMHVIGRLLGLTPDEQDRLHELSDVLVSSSGAPGASAAAARDIGALLGAVAAAKRAAPADDLTSALIAAREEQDRLSEAELIGLMLQLVVAGHETTLNLICNAVRALLTHPEQLQLVRDGAVPWSAVVEETLRWDAPVGQFPMRYALEDIDLGDGVVIRAGDGMLASYAAAGRDPEHWADADRFDLTRSPVRHLSLGHGPHFCIGSALARLEAETALRELFARFPGLRLAEGAEPRPIASFVSNGVSSLRVRLS